MPKLTYFYALLVAANLLLMLPPPAQAQGSNSICIWAYEDSNQNGARDAGELYIGEIVANLSLNGVILQSKITPADNTPVCFEGLSDGVYTMEALYGGSYRPTSENKSDFNLSNTTRGRVEFGVVPLTADEIQAAQTAEKAGADLTITRRLMIAGLGSSLVMALMLGLGLLIGAYRYL